MAIFALAGVAISATVLLMLSRSKLRRRRGRKQEGSEDSNDETFTIGDTTGEITDTPVKSKVNREDAAEVIDENDLINDMYLLGEIHPQ